jgi:hypothetical protein
MALTLDDGLNILEEARALALRVRIDLDDQYLANIVAVEARADNQSGADKTWVSRMDRSFRFQLRGAIQIR